MAKLETLSITLPRDMADAVRDRVEAGEFGSTSEAVLDALALWQAERERNEAKRRWLVRKVERSLADPRPSIPAEEVFEEIEASLDAR